MDIITGSHPAPVLTTLQVELSSFCGARCVMCPNQGQSVPRSHMDLEMLREIFRQAAALGTLASPVGICGLGEPLMHPQYARAFEIAAASGISWSLGTNADGLDAAAIDAIIATRPKSVVMSLDAMSAEALKTIRPGVNFDRAHSGAIALIEAIRRSGAGIAPWVQLIATNTNQHEWESFINTFSGLMNGLPGATIYIKRCCYMPGAQMPPDVYPGPSLIGARVLATVAQAKTSASVIVDPGDGPWALTSTSRPICQLPLSYMMIRSDGTAILCCMDSDNLTAVGSVAQNTITEIFNSEMSTRMRASLCFNDAPAPDSVPSLCARCIKWVAAPEDKPCPASPS